jgi:hypothetical protein
MSEQTQTAVGGQVERRVRLQLADAQKERPILFSAPMVRALLGGTKTQTRRVVKPQPEAEHGGEPYWFIGGYRAWTYRDTQDVLRKGVNLLSCQYGNPGDRLYVRETWAQDSEDGTLFYRADVGSGNGADDWERNRLDGAPGYQWRPSIHMPRIASRIHLEIVAVRIERLQEISEEDALAEGVKAKWEPGCSGRLMEAIGGLSFRPAASAYADLWEQINGGGSWDSNPWVWVVEFRRLHLQPNVGVEPPATAGDGR